MFVRQHQNQFRNANADVQIFYRDSTWNKPPGVSQIYMMLIGAGGAADSGTSYGGNSGNVTTWWGSAQNVPDSLIISPAPVTAGTGSDSTISYRRTSLVTLLTAGGGNTAGNANIADAATPFANSGIYKNTLGQPGTIGSPSASTTTFLSAGTINGSPGGTSNYGYQMRTSTGSFLFQPIIVGVGNGNDALSTFTTSIGCGGSGSASGRGGPGMVLIASW